PFAEHPGEPRLRYAGRPEAPAGVEGGVDRAPDDRMVVAVEPGRVLAEQVDVLVTVQVGDAAAGAAANRQRERRVIDRAARGATRQDRHRLVVGRPAGRVRLDVPLPGS